MKLFVDAEDSKPNPQLARLPELPCCEGSQLMGMQPELPMALLSWPLI